MADLRVHGSRGQENDEARDREDGKDSRKDDHASSRAAPFLFGLLDGLLPTTRRRGGPGVGCEGSSLWRQVDDRSGRGESCGGWWREPTIPGLGPPSGAGAAGPTSSWKGAQLLSRWGSHCQIDRSKGGLPGFRKGRRRRGPLVSVDAVDALPGPVYCSRRASASSVLPRAHIGCNRIQVPAKMADRVLRPLALCNRQKEPEGLR